MTVESEPPASKREIVPEKMHTRMFMREAIAWANKVKVKTRVTGAWNKFKIHVTSAGAWMVKNWKAISVVGGIFAFLVSTYLTWRSLSDTLEITRQIAEVNLARDLSRTYDKSELFERIRRGIVYCTLGEGEGPGMFHSGDINKFINFLDDVAFYYHRGAVSQDVMEHLFRSLIIETYHYPGMQNRIKGMERKGKEKGVNEDFLSLGAELTERFPEQAAYWATNCDRRKEAVKGG